MLRVEIWERSMENDGYKVVGAQGDCRSRVLRRE